MSARRLHRTLGLVMLLPFVGWVVTGAVFFLKPGYAGAYEIPQIRTYPLSSAVTVRPDPAWLEFRFLRTALGDHLLARTAQGWTHLDPATLLPKAPPNEEEVRALVTDAIEANPDRYGQITEITGNRIKTSTGVTVTLDWGRLALSQRGRDTERLDWLYRIHYLQWTGVTAVDKVLGGLGLAMVLALAALGLWLALARS